MQHCEAGPNRIEGGNDLICGGQQKELAGIAGALLEQRGSRIAVGIDLHRVEGDPGRFDVVAQDLLACIDL